MAYCVLKKDGRQGNIIHFLADTNKDFPFIIDDCDPGSTIKVLNTGGTEANKVTTHMKAPSGQWVKVDGEGDALPANNVEISLPDPQREVDSCGFTVAQMQSNVQVYQSGLVTGTTHAVKGNKLFRGEKADGHFLTIMLEKPEKATKVSIKGGESDRTDLSVPTDNTYMLRLDGAVNSGKDTFTFEFKSEGEDDKGKGSFELNISQVVLD